MTNLTPNEQTVLTAVRELLTPYKGTTYSDIDKNDVRNATGLSHKQVSTALKGLVGHGLVYLATAFGWDNIIHLENH